MVGYIYCLTNTSFPGLVKIGKTKNNPQIRAAKLGSASGVPTEFQIAWSRKVANIDAAESALHRALGDRRVNKRREFFKCKPSHALASAKKLPDFRSVKPAHSRPRTAQPEGRLGLSLAAMMVLMFLAACLFDLDAKTTVTGIAAFASLLTVFFWTTGIMRMVRE